MRSLSRRVLTLALATLPVALAVRPPESTTLGDVPVRLPAQHRGASEALRRSPAWTQFTAGEGAGWQAQWDVEQGVPFRMWGGGIAVPTASADDVGAFALQFVAAHEALLGASGYAPALRGVAYAEDTDVWYVDVDLTRDGVPVYDGGITLRVASGHLVMVGSRAVRNAPASGGFAISTDAAFLAAEQQGHAPLAAHLRGEARAVWVPTEVDGAWELIPTWEVRTRTESPLGQWVSWVDAATGRLLHQGNEIRFFDGQILGQRDDRLLTTLITEPMPFVKVSGGGSTFTDADGNFSLTGSGPFTIDLDGSRVRVRDQMGDVNPQIAAAATTTLTSAEFGSRQAPLTTYYAVYAAEEYAKTLDRSNQWANSRCDANVNINDVCNAYFDGSSVNFFRSGGGCQNTGRLADVVYHEWGHGFHTYAIRTGTYDGSLGEGAADFYSALMTDDNRLAPGFFTGTNGPLRNLDNNARYPDDFNPDPNYIHYNGLIFGGAMWDSRLLLQADLGAADGKRVITAIFLEMLRGGPDIPGSYAEAILADDDDGDLRNGTPHQCALIEGFGLHGLGPQGYQGLLVDHVPVTDAQADTDAPITLSVSSPAPACFDAAAQTATLHWRVIGDTRWKDVDLAVAGTDVSGAIPGQPLGTAVEYYVEIADDGGAAAFAPLDGEIRPYTFIVGEGLKVDCFGFENNDGGFTSALIAGQATEGANDWMWGAPQGLGGDPTQAASGTNVWGNDLGGDNYNGLYQDGKQNRLTSPAFATRHYEDVYLRYNRWLGVEDGTFDKARILADDETVWKNFKSGDTAGSAHHVDDAWADHVVPLEGYADDGSVVLAWEIETDQGVGFGGWNIDDVCVYAPATPNNRLGINAMTAAISGTTATLTWTMPYHDPVTEVVIVRKAGSAPTGPTDGLVVYRTSTIGLGETATATDGCAYGEGDFHYAAYATDGTDWLGWTRPGFNTAAVTAEVKSPDRDLKKSCEATLEQQNPGAVDPGGSLTASGGCAGCASSTPVSGAWALAPLAALLRRRRR
ncbi:MAG: hypothetical protein RLZZ383_554 [Pseudomonadota bacterium]